MHHLGPQRCDHQPQDTNGCPPCQICIVIRNQEFSKANEKLQKFFSLISEKNYYFYLIGFFVKIKLIVSDDTSNISNNLSNVLQDLIDIKKKSQDQDFKQELNLIEKIINALQLKSKNRLFQKAKSMEILREFLFEPTPYQEIIIIQYIEILLDEIKLYYNSEAIVEFKELIDQLLILGGRLVNFNLIMQSFFLNELMRLLSNDKVQNLKENMNRFEDILKKYPEFNLLSTFNEEKSKFFNIVDKLGTLEFSKNKFHNLQYLELELYLDNINKNILHSQRLTKI